MISREAGPTGAELGDVPSSSVPRVIVKFITTDTLDDIRLALHKTYYNSGLYLPQTTTMAEEFPSTDIITLTR